MSASTHCYDTTTIEGNSVLKMAPGGLSFAIYGPVDCRTASYRPAVITARDNNSIGETISGSNGDPESSSYYGYHGLYYNYASAPLDLHDV